MPKVSWRGGAMLAPVPPALVSCGDMENSNIITVAWTGILSTIPPKTYISVRPERHSYEMIKQSGEFVINLTTSELVRAADWCGARSGRKHDKFAECKLEKEAAQHLLCPIIAQSPLALECKVCDIVPLGSHDMFIADIVCVDVDESLLDRDGKLHLERAHLAAYAHGEYFELGRRIGSFGYSVKKKKRYSKPSGKK
jgi:flavin reductase (DIM6/NTAB) family NADH-FMN oxidoreductase RutF